MPFAIVFLCFSKYASCSLRSRSAKISAITGFWPRWSSDHAPIFAIRPWRKSSARPVISSVRSTSFIIALVGILHPAGRGLRTFSFLIACITCVT